MRTHKPSSLSATMIGAAVLAGASLLFTAGCSGDKNRDNIAWGGGDKDQTLKVTNAGDFGLYQPTDPKRPILIFHVDTGDSLGFERGNGREVVAVAGDHRVPMPEGEYFWNRIEEPKPAKTSRRKRDE